MKPDKTVGGENSKRGLRAKNGYAKEGLQERTAGRRKGDRKLNKNQQGQGKGGKGQPKRGLKDETKAGLLFVRQRNIWILGV